MFVDTFDSICAEAGVAPTRVLIELGISKGAYSNWKNGGEPSNVVKKKIADYFNITVKQLMEGQIKKAPAKAEADDELLDMLEDVRRNPDLRTLFSLSKNATPEDVRSTIKIIKALRGDYNGEDNN